MPRAFPSILLASLVVVALAPRLASAAGDTAKDCIAFSGEARFGGVGFTHIVHITNKCTASAVCAVSTDVVPTPQSVTVPGNKSVEVVTYLDSPASKFTPRVTCEMK
jgi:hypothetical protein